VTETFLEQLPAWQTGWLDLDQVKDTNYLTHGLHPYPAKFIPQIPASLMDRFLGRASVIADPFCGSGTVAVEASLRGHTAYVSDSNPIAVLITRAKTTRLDKASRKSLAALRQELSARPRAGSHPSFKNIDHWFTEKMTSELAAIKETIYRICDNEIAKTLASAIFSAIVVKCSRQESDTRWVAVDKQTPAGFAFTLYDKKLTSALAAVEDFTQRARGRVNAERADARDLRNVTDGIVDLVITSPPYLNSYDYYLYHKLRMFWLGFDHYEVQRAEIGSRNKHCDEAAPVADYVSAMTKCLSEATRILAPSGVAAIIVGDSIVGGQKLDMDTVFIDIALRCGLSLFDRFSYCQRKYTRAFFANYRRESKQTHILLFRRPGAKPASIQ
jgi:site-specific DNA-methyltransferase (cytosine-N4-specific)